MAIDKSKASDVGSLTNQDYGRPSIFSRQNDMIVAVHKVATVHRVKTVENLFSKQYRQQSM